MIGAFKIEIHGTKFEVEYAMSGLYDDAEIDEMNILVNGKEEISADCLDQKVLRQIDKEAYEDYWNKAQCDGPEPDEMEDR